MKIEAFTASQASLLELVEACDDHYNVSPLLPNIEVDNGGEIGVDKDSASEANETDKSTLKEGLFKLAEKHGKNLPDSSELVIEEVTKRDPSNVSEVIKWSGSRAVLFTMTLPEALKKEVDELIDLPESKEAGYTTLDEYGRHHFTERECRIGELVLGCLLGKEAQTIASSFARQRLVLPTYATAYMNPGFAREYLEYIAGLPYGDAQSLTFALRADIAGILNEIYTQAGLSNLEDSDVIALSLWKSIFNTQLHNDSPITTSPTQIDTATTIGPDRCVLVSIRTDIYLYLQMEQLANIDFTDVNEQFRAGFARVWSQQPSAFELSALSKSPYPKAGDFPLRPLSNKSVSGGIYTAEKTTQSDDYSEPLLIPIDRDVYEELTYAGFSAEEISAIVSTCTLAYIDARLSDPDIARKRDYANTVYDALEEMYDHERNSGKSTQRVNVLVRGFMGTLPYPEAVFAAHAQYFGSNASLNTEDAVEKKMLPQS